MNVEKLIEEGWKKTEEELPFRHEHSRSEFALGVRHAIAAMFPVVNDGEYEYGKLYFAMWDNQIPNDWTVVNYAGGGVGMETYNGECDMSEFKSIRRCPTPSELGVW